MSRKHLVRLGSCLALLAVVSACSDSGPTDPSPELNRADNAQDQLERWFNQSSPVVLALGGTVFADNDEVARKLVFGVENEAAMPGVRRALAALRIPETAYAIKLTKPIHQMATLRDVFRPTIGGIQIHFGQYLCTMGFNADAGGARSFITNSHCTNTQGGVEGTQYFQPLSSADGTVIATEVADPEYFRGGACPRGKRCRYSDASRAVYSNSVASSRGVIARTTGANNGSLTTDGTFSITGEGSAGVGATVNKVGRTTGWTQGAVTRTCVNTSVSGGNIMQLCQTFVTNNGAVVVGSGDSGSPVFIASGTNAVLVGILWGGSSDNKTFVFSPLNQVEQELGALTTN